MNKEFIKNVVFSDIRKNDNLIKRGDLIDFELTKILMNAKTTEITNAFYRYDNLTPTDKVLYEYQIKCPICGKIYTRMISKTRILNMIKCINNKDTNNEYFRCEECETEYQKQIKIKQSISHEKWEKERKEELANLTLRYKEYLNPKACFRDGVSAKDKINYIMYQKYGTNPDQDEIYKEINNMDYSDFLHTPYWDGVRNYKLKSANYRCQLCGKSGKLNVHHKTYENHGREHMRSVADNDLIVLCENCHRKFHDKLDRAAGE